MQLSVLFSQKSVNFGPIFEKSVNFGHIFEKKCKFRTFCQCTEYHTHLTHISNNRKLKANFCGRENEGHFRSKNFLRALKWVPAWYTYTIATKSLLSDWLPRSESQSERSILWLSCRYIMWVLILKLSKSFYYESDLLFHVHKSWLSTS